MLNTIHDITHKPSAIITQPSGLEGGGGFSSVILIVPFDLFLEFRKFEVY
jgi:hypothetical protein